MNTSRWPSTFKKTALMCISATIISACGGDRDGGTEVSDPEPPITVTEPLLAYEEREDGTFAMFRVDVGTGERVTLDQGSTRPYRGRLIGQRVYFVRALEVPLNGSTVTDRDLYSVKLDGTDTKQLTSGAGDDQRIQPVGDRLVFLRIQHTSQHAQNWDVMSMQLDGGDLRALADDPLQNELALEFTNDVVIIEATGQDGKRGLSARRANGLSLAVEIAAPTAQLAYRDLVGDRVIFSTPGKVFSRRLDGSNLIDLFQAEGARFYSRSIGDRLIAEERTQVNGNLVTDLHMVNVDGSEKSLLAQGSSLAGVAPGAPDRVFLNLSVGNDVQLFERSLSLLPGTPRLLATSDRKSFLAEALSGASIFRRLRVDDPDIGFSVEFVSLLETNNGIREVVLSSRSDTTGGAEGYHGAVDGRLVINTFIGLSEEGAALLKHIAISADGAETRVLAEDEQGDHFVPLQVRPDGRVVFIRTAADGVSGVARQELIAIQAKDGNVVKLSPLSRSAGLVPLL